MCRIQPFVDLATGSLTVSAPGMPDLILPLDYLGQENEPDGVRGEGKTDGDSTNGDGDSRFVEGGSGGGDNSGESGDTPVTVRVCGNRRAGVTCAASASAWFTRFLGVRCSLIRAAVVGASDWSDDGSGKPYAGDTPAVNSGNGDDGNGSGAAPNPLSNGETFVGRSAVSRVMTWLPARLRGDRRSPSRPVPTAEDDGGGAAGSRAFANEAPFLLIARASVAKANDMIRRNSGTNGGGEEAANGGAESSDNHKEVCVF